TVALLEAALGIDRVAAELPAFLQQMTEGNPFFLQELVRMLVERGELTHDAATVRWERHTAGELAVPETVREAIGERGGRRRVWTQEVLREASVLGQVFALAPLQRMGEHLEATVEEAVEEALLAGLLREVREPAHGHKAHSSFSHALTQRAVYATIPARAVVA